MTVATKKFQVMSTIISIVDYKEDGAEKRRSVHHQGDVLELDTEDEAIERYVELGALMDLEAARKQEAADARAQAEALLAQAKEKQEEAKILAAQAKETENPKEEAASASAGGAAKK